MSRAVMQQALETAEGIVNSDWRKWEELASPAEFERWAKSRANFMATVLREALAQPEQGPVAWVKFKDGEITHSEMSDGSGVDMDLTDWIPLYTAPPREWQWLTVQEVGETWDKTGTGFIPQRMLQFYMDIEARLKEKNA